MKIDLKLANPVRVDEAGRLGKRLVFIEAKGSLFGFYSFYRELVGSRPTFYVTFSSTVSII